MFLCNMGFRAVKLGRGQTCPIDMVVPCCADMNGVNLLDDVLPLECVERRRILSTGRYGMHGRWILQISGLAVLSPGSLARMTKLSRIYDCFGVKDCGPAKLGESIMVGVGPICISTALQKRTLCWVPKSCLVHYLFLLFSGISYHPCAPAGK